MGKRALKKRIESLSARVEEDREKIRAEAAKKYPNPGLIQHWEAEVLAFQSSIERARKRLGQS